MKKKTQNFLYLKSLGKKIKNLTKEEKKEYTHLWYIENLNKKNKTLRHKNEYLTLLNKKVKELTLEEFSIYKGYRNKKWNNIRRERVKCTVGKRKLTKINNLLNKLIIELEFYLNKYKR